MVFWYVGTKKINFLGCLCLFKQQRRQSLCRVLFIKHLKVYVC